MTLQTLLLFIGAEVIFSSTPGPAVMLVNAYGFRGGPWRRKITSAPKPP